MNNQIKPITQQPIPGVFAAFYAVARRFNAAWLVMFAALLFVGPLISGCGPQSPIARSAAHELTVSAPRSVTLVVTLHRVPQFSEFTGSVHPQLESTLSARVSARVVQVLAHEGDHVRAGQTLIQLDARDLDASVNQATAGLTAANVSLDTARVAARMEDSLSNARLREAHARVAQAQATLQAATAKFDLVQAGPRRQERDQAAQTVAQAQSALTLAESNLKRMDELVKEGAISAQQHDVTLAQYQAAKAQYKAAVQGKSAIDEGSRPEEVRAAKEAVGQAQAGVHEANAGLDSARAEILQAAVRKQEIESAKAQIGQSRAGVSIARTTRAFAVIAAPFDGIVTQRLVDPGAMAGPGVPLMKIQGGAMRLETVVPESILRAVHLGAQVTVIIDALAGKPLAGIVVEIAPQGDEASHSFVIRIELPRHSGSSSGMFGRAQIATGEQKLLLVPASAIWEREGLNYLYTVDESHIARLRLVTVGKPQAADTPVLSGLTPGERVIISDHTEIEDGSPVAADRAEK